MRRDVAGHSVVLVVLGFLVVMFAATLGLALLVNAGGARHPGLLASFMVALMVEVVALAEPPAAAP